MQMENILKIKNAIYPPEEKKKFNFKSNSNSKCKQFLNDLTIHEFKASEYVLSSNSSNTILNPNSHKNKSKSALKVPNKTKMDYSILGKKKLNIKNIKISETSTENSARLRPKSSENNYNNSRISFNGKNFENFTQFSWKKEIIDKNFNKNPSKINLEYFPQPHKEYFNKTTDEDIIQSYVKRKKHRAFLVQTTNKDCLMKMKHSQIFSLKFLNDILCKINFYILVSHNCRCQEGENFCTAILLLRTNKNSDFYLKHFKKSFIENTVIIPNIPLDTLEFNLKNSNSIVYYLKVTQVKFRFQINPFEENNKNNFEIKKLQKSLNFFNYSRDNFDNFLVYYSKKNSTFVNLLDKNLYLLLFALNSINNDKNSKRADLCLMKKPLEEIFSEKFLSGHLNQLRFVCIISSDEKYQTNNSKYCSKALLLIDTANLIKNGINTNKLISEIFSIRFYSNVEIKLDSNFYHLDNPNCLWRTKVYDRNYSIRLINKSENFGFKLVPKESDFSKIFSYNEKHKKLLEIEHRIPNAINKNFDSENKLNSPKFNINNSVPVEFSFANELNLLSKKRRKNSNDNIKDDAIEINKK